jgi:proteasome beta subunit
MLMDITKENSRHGTTTLGLVCSGGVILAADKRASMGYMVASKTMDKILSITDKIAMTTAGLVGDAQMLAKYLKAEMELYEVRRQKRVNVKAAASLLSNIMFGQRPFPFYVQLLLAGADEKGYHLYSLDPSGSLIADRYTSTGSGSVFAFGVLEDKFKENMSVEEGIHVAVRAMKVALARDIATGDGIDIWLINNEGTRKLKKEEIEKAF